MKLIFFLFILSFPVHSNDILKVSQGDIIDSNKFNDLIERINISNNKKFKKGRSGSIHTTSTSYSLIPDRTLAISKLRDDTDIYMEYTDSYRVAISGKMCSLKIVVEDQQGNYVCSNTPIEHNDYENGSSTINTQTFKGYCQGIPKGDYLVKVYFKTGNPDNTGSYGSSARCEINWDGSNDFILFAEEKFLIE